MNFSIVDTKIIILFLCIVMVPIFAAKKPRLQAGDVAPDFILQGDDGKTYSLSDFDDQKLVLFFYPRDDSYYCTKQVCSLAQGYNLLKKSGIQLFGINHQSVKSHQAFKQKHAVPFTLLSDPKSEAIKAYGAYSPFLTKRITVLIEDGKIVQILRKIDVNEHADQILKAFSS